MTSTSDTWTLHPDRALPGDPETRAIAREIYAQTARLPIVSMHGHVPVEWFAQDRPFENPAELLVTPDHYVTRMLVSQGADLADLGVPDATGAGAPVDPRAIWRRLCAGWKHFRGTPSRFWLEAELVEIFGITQRPGAHNADALYDQIAARIAEPNFRPRALMDTFGIEVLTTTDPAWSRLEHHETLAEQGWGQRVLPTFRPDPLMHLDRPSWQSDLDRLGAASGVTVTSYARFLEALRTQRDRFRAAGARASDHAALTADTTPLPEAQAVSIFDKALRAAEGGPAITAQESAAFGAHMIFQMAAMAAEDHLVMQFHPGSLRDYDTRTASRVGPDRGYDIPVAVDFTRGLRPLLEAFGHDPGFRMIAFTLDEDTYSRELAPLAGVYPALRLGAPWWFLDSPEAMRRFRESATETAGFSNLSGFVDDTRAFCSIPTRHDLARRIDAGYLARLVVEHRLDLDEAVDTAQDLAYRLPVQAYEAR